MAKSDLDIVAPLVVQYYDWLSDNGGIDPEVLLSHQLTRSQRRLLLDRMDDANVLWGLTAPYRALMENSPLPGPSRTHRRRS